MDYALIGYGRMGRAVDEQARARGHRRCAIVDEPASVAPLDASRLDGAGVAFEFTVAAACEDRVRSLLGSGISVVCGTTGWTPSRELREFAVSAEAALVLAPNFSLGVNVFFRIARQAAAALAALGLHEPFVEESHHRGKMDVPSGTARRLAALVAEADPRINSIVEGHPDGRLPDGALQVTGTRAGAEPGTHRVGFDGPHERITLEHCARGREGFALGAVLAAEWLVGKRGVHEFDEVLDAILDGTLSVEGVST